MTAPLPLRFYNPVKELCQKVNLDYETVLGNALSPAMREAYINAEIPKPVSEFRMEDRKAVKRKIEFYNKKYGNGSICKGETEGGAREDKGRIRYDAGASVEYPLPDDGKTDEPSTLPNSVDGIRYSRGTSVNRAERWVPGKGVIVAVPTL